jgi:hypothetical protein
MGFIRLVNPRHHFDWRRNRINRLAFSWSAEEKEHKRQERGYWSFQRKASVLTLFFSFVAATGAIVGAIIAYNAFVASTKAVAEAKRQADEAGRQATAAETQIENGKIAEIRQLRAYLHILTGELARV